MSYEDYYREFIENDKEYKLKEKKYKNRHSDKKQYEKYKNVGIEVPKSFDKFQELKYKDSIGYWRASNQYKSFSSIDKKGWSESFSKKCKETIKKFANEYDLDLNEHSVARYHDRISNKKKDSYMCEKDFIELAKSKPNYKESSGNLVVYKNKTAIIFDTEYKTHIKTVIVDRNKPRKDWVEL